MTTKATSSNTSSTTGIDSSGTTETSTESQRDYTALLAAGLDFDNSGNVDQWEKTLRNKVTGTNDKAKWRALTKLRGIADANNDGKVTQTEMNNVFNIVDINKNRKLDAKEIFLVSAFVYSDGKRGLSDADMNKLNAFKTQQGISTSTIVDNDDIFAAYTYISK